MTDSAMGTTQYELRGVVTIRQMQYRDLPKLEWYGQFRHFRQLFRRSYEGQLKGNRYLMIADYNQFPIARIFIRFKTRDSKIADGEKRAYLYSFQVMEMFQGQGIGTQLILKSESLLRSQNFQEVSIAVARDNAGALRLYQRHGYQIFKEDEGRWQYPDHRGRIRRVHEPCWLLEKYL